MNAYRFSDLDALTGGFSRGELILLVGRTSIGKTSLALNVAAQAAVRNKAVVLYSLEMNEERIFQRLLSAASRVPIYELSAGWVTSQSWPKLVGGVAEVSRYPIQVIDSPHPSFGQIRRAVQKFGDSSVRSGRSPVSLMMVDYLQLVLPTNSRSEARQCHIADIVGGFQGHVARDFDIPILMIAQLDATPDRRVDKRPRLADLGELEKIEQHADKVMFLYRDEYYNPDSDDKGIAEVIVGKHRNGPTGKVQLAWLEPCGKFASLARRVQTA